MLRQTATVRSWNRAPGALQSARPGAHGDLSTSCSGQYRGCRGEISFSPALVAAIETGRRLPSVDFASQCDDVLSADGQFGRMQARLLDESGPSWLREWAGIEREEVILRSWEPLLIPGLLQTADYAHEHRPACTRAWPGRS